MRAYTEPDYELLSDVAWATRESAHAVRTKVGAAVMTGSGCIYGGCNIEDLWKCGSVHAERAAITHALIHGDDRITDILLAADREDFAPCGMCIDFIRQFGGPDCRVWFEKTRGVRVLLGTVADLMPRYPK